MFSAIIRQELIREISSTTRSNYYVRFKLYNKFRVSNTSISLRIIPTNVSNFISRLQLLHGKKRCGLREVTCYVRRGSCGTESEIVANTACLSCHV